MGTFSDKEHSERNAHIVARTEKEAAPFLDGPKAKMEALEADAKAAQEAGAALTALGFGSDELKAFATPATVMEAVDKLSAAVKEKADAARELVKEQKKAAAEATPQNAGTAEAKKQLE